MVPCADHGDHPHTMKPNGSNINCAQCWMNWIEAQGPDGSVTLADMWCVLNAIRYEGALEYARAKTIRAKTISLELSS